MPQDTKTIFVILPCYNEASNLVKLIPKIGNILKENYLILAVNDGSSDETDRILKELSQEYPIITLRHEENKGLHEALKTGFLEAIRLGKPGDIIITLDADNTHNPVYFPRLLEAIIDLNADICVASRYVHGGSQVNVPFIRIVLSRGINGIIRLISRIHIKDITSGYRAYKWECIKNTLMRLKDNFIVSRGFEVSVELLIKVYYFGNCKNVIEIPILLDYGIKEGKSKMNVSKTIIRYIRLIPKIRKWKYEGGKNE